MNLKTETVHMSVVDYALLRVGYLLLTFLLVMHWGCERAGKVLEDSSSLVGCSSGWKIAWLLARRANVGFFCDKSQDYDKMY